MFYLKVAVALLNVSLSVPLSFKYFWRFSREKLEKL
jgi:hypothetical protein